MSAKILVVDDNPINLKLVSDVLEFEGYDILKAVDAEEAQVVLAATLPDLILMDIALPGMDGLTLTRILKAEERTRGIRIVALTAFAMKGDDQKVLEAGCDGYVTKPIDTRKLPDEVAGFLARASGQSWRSRMKILVIEDHASDLKLADLVLSTAGHDVSAVKAAEQAIATIQEDRPRLILIDLDLPGIDGLALVRRLKADPDTRDIHVVAVTCHPEQYPKADALVAGCDAYLLKPIETRDLFGLFTGAPPMATQSTGRRKKGPMNLLIVDDHLTNLKLLRAQLESEGHTVFEAHDGVDAFALLNRQRVDAVISDILMPRMDGYRLCHEIRKHARLRDLPIIIYSSTYTAPEDEMLALEMGADKYLKKPASVETITTALHEVIVQSRAVPRPDALREVEVLKRYNDRLVSKLKEKNAELQAAAVKFRALVEQSIVGIYIIQDDQFGYVNPRMAGIFGRSEEEITSRTVYDFVVPEDHALARENIRKQISGGVPSIHYHLRMLHQSGAVLQVEVHSSRTDYNGRPAVMGTLLDITERNRVEEALRESEERFKNLFNQAPLGIALIDSLTGDIYAVNPMFAGIAGRTMEEMAHIDWMSITHPDDVKKDLDNMALLNAGEITGFQVEKRYLHPDGAVVWINMTVAPVKGVDKTHPRHLCMIENITDHKAAEEALRESERKYRFLVANAHEAIFIAQDNVVKFPNPKALEMTGYSTEELAGVPFTDLIHPEDRDTVLERCIDRLRGEPPRETYPFRIMKKTGEEIWAQLTAELIDWEGRPGVLCFLRDITKERNLEAQFLQAQKMEAVGTLAGGIAHDFNNALTGIVGFGELLRMRMAGDEQALHDLDEILRCGERAATLTRQLLTFARRQVIEPVNLDLNALVADLMKLIGKVVGEHIEVKTSPGKDVPTIHADPGQIEQVLMNLCLNARDAMPDGGRLVVETGDVHLDEGYVLQNPYMTTGRYALLTVSDTGVGMDETTRERAFEPFFTTKGPDKGTGLGLAMVYGIVKQHGGYIHLYSEPGKGTAFKVYFPAVETPPDAVPAMRREEIVRGGTETILLAEDEEALRSLARRILSGFGYTVLVARDGEEAIEEFGRHDGIALAVLDVVMPRKGGKEAFEEMHKRNPRLKVIFMSGYSADAIHDSFVLTPGTSFLQKPFGPTVLARKVRETLDTL